MRTIDPRPALKKDDKKDKKKMMKFLGATTSHEALHAKHERQRGGRRRKRYDK